MVEFSKKILRWLLISMLFFGLQLYLMPLISFKSFVPSLIELVIIVVAFAVGGSISLVLALFYCLLQRAFIFDEALMMGWLLIPSFIEFVLKKDSLNSSSVMLSLQVILCTLIMQSINYLQFYLMHKTDVILPQQFLLILGLSMVFNLLLFFPLRGIINKVILANDRLRDTRSYNY